MLYDIAMVVGIRNLTKVIARFASGPVDVVNALEQAFEFANNT